MNRQQQPQQRKNFPEKASKSKAAEEVVEEEGGGRQQPPIARGGVRPTPSSSSSSPLYHRRNLSDQQRFAPIYAPFTAASVSPGQTPPLSSTSSSGTISSLHHPDIYRSLSSPDPARLHAMTSSPGPGPGATLSTVESHSRSALPTGPSSYYPSGMSRVPLTLHDTHPKFRSVPAMAHRSSDPGASRSWADQQFANDSLRLEAFKNLQLDSASAMPELSMNLPSFEPVKWQRTAQYDHPFSPPGSASLQPRIDVTRGEFEVLMATSPRLVPPEEPIYVEPNTTFRVSFKQNKLNGYVEKIGVFHKNHHVDFKFDGQACQFKCQAYHRCADLDFYVNIYRAKSQETSGSQMSDECVYITEFQRRRGDVVHFADLYQKAVRNLSDLKDLAVYQSPPQLDPPKLTMETGALAARNLSEMVNSKYLETKCEGIRCLAHLSTMHENYAPMVEGGAVQTLVESLASDTECVHRCAATGVANLASQNDVSTIVYNKGGVDALVKLVLTSETLEVLREAGRALYAVSQKLGRTIITPQLREGAEKLKTTPDATAHRYGACLGRLIEQASRTAAVF